MHIYTTIVSPSEHQPAQPNSRDASYLVCKRLRVQAWLLAADGAFSRAGKADGARIARRQGSAREQASAVNRGRKSNSGRLDDRALLRTIFLASLE